MQVVRHAAARLGDLDPLVVVRVEQMVARFWPPPRALPLAIIRRCSFSPRCADEEFHKGRVVSRKQCA